MTNARLAAHLNITPPAVTEMLQRLADRALVVYTPYRGVTLTEQGQQLALTVLRRYRLLMLYLVEMLDCPWDEVSGEADALEHALSDRLVTHIAARLGHPATDPFGDPIPRPDGTLPACHGLPLSDLPLQCIAQIVRIVDQQPDHLRYFANVGLVPGAHVMVHARTAGSEWVDLSIHGVKQLLDLELAHAILVLPIASPMHEQRCTTRAGSCLSMLSDA